MQNPSNETEAAAVSAECSPTPPPPAEAPTPKTNELVESKKLDVIDNDFVDSFSPTERERLAELEAVIHRGLHTFLEVGRALYEIWYHGLHRETHRSFGNYVREKFGFERAHAHRLITSVDIVRNLYPTGDVLGRVTEYSLRPLTKLPPQKQVEAWARAIELAGGKAPSAKLVRQAIRSLDSIKLDATSSSHVEDTDEAQVQRGEPDSEPAPEGEQLAAALEWSDMDIDLSVQSSSHYDQDTGDFVLADGAFVSGWTWIPGPVPADRVRTELTALQSASQSVRKIVRSQKLLVKIASEINSLMADAVREISSNQGQGGQGVLYESPAAFADSLETAASLLCRMLRPEAAQSSPLSPAPTHD